MAKTKAPSNRQVRLVSEKVWGRLQDFSGMLDEDDWDLFVQGLFGIAPAAAQAMIKKLTPREREVAELMASGLNNTNIAEQLGISRKTLDIHRGKIKWKWDLNTSLGIARIWYAAQLAKEGSPRLYSRKESPA